MKHPASTIARHARALSATFCALLLLITIKAQASVIPEGDADQVAQLGNVELKIFTYRPDCANPSLLLAFHGDDRNALGARNHSRPIARKHCLLVVAPLMDRKRFPHWRYHHGGVTHDGVVQDTRSWTGHIVLRLVEWTEQSEGRPLSYAMIGHSAGGQFLSRFAAFIPNKATRIVVANPGSYVMPSLEVEAPRGFGEVYSGAAGEAALRRYLAAPLTILLGEDDFAEAVGDSAETKAQGLTRLARGLNAFEQGRQLAARNDWPFHWRLIVVPGVGHSSKKLYASPQAWEALKP